MQCAVVGGNLLRSENIQSLLNKNRWKWMKVFTVGRGTPHLVRGGVCGSKRGGGGGWGTPRRVGTPAGASAPGPARVLPVQGNLCPQQAVGIRISILSSTVPYILHITSTRPIINGPHFAGWGPIYTEPIPILDETTILEKKLFIPMK